MVLKRRVSWAPWLAQQIACLLYLQAIYRIVPALWNLATSIYHHPWVQVSVLYSQALNSACMEIANVLYFCFAIICI